MRMSVLVKDGSKVATPLRTNSLINGQHVLYTKGADATVLPRTHLYDEDTAASRALTELMVHDLDAYSGIGLRTLVVAKRELTDEEFIQYSAQLKVKPAFRQWFNPCL